MENTTYKPATLVLHAGREAVALDERTAAVPFSVFFGAEAG